LTYLSLYRYRDVFLEASEKFEQEKRAAEEAEEDEDEDDVESDAEKED
jgi:hypothetical protein